MTLGSLFDGIGGFPLAAFRNNITPVWASEIEAVLVSITKRHFPDMKHLGDITKIHGAGIAPVDIITFGSPCQDLSIAGKRAGLTGERSGLFMEAIKIIKEMRDATRGASPRFCVWENVPGAFSSNGGEDFRSVLEEIAKISDKDISIPGPSSEYGWTVSGGIMGDVYSLAWRVLDAQYWGVPQRRRRIFLVADFGGRCAGEILFERKSLHGDIAAGHKAWEKDSPDIASRAVVAILPVITGSLRARADSSPCIDNGQPFVCAAFMGGQGAKAGSIAYNEKIAPTLKGAASGGNQIPCIIYDAIGNGGNNVPLAVHQNQCGEVRVGNVANTINTNGNASGRNAPIVAVMQGFGDYKETGVASSLKSRDFKYATDLVADNFCVRRLTPTECERLQGFPDGWTEYGHDGKQISDSQRYKALGNSVAIPCVDFIFRNIQRVTKHV